MNDLKQKHWAGVPWEMLEYLMNADLSGRECKIVFFLIRHIQGEQKKERLFRVSDFSEGTGIDPTNVGKSINSLVSKGIIRKSECRLSKTGYYWYQFDEQTLKRTHSTNTVYPDKKGLTLIKGGVDKSANQSDTSSKTTSQIKTPSQKRLGTSSKTTSPRAQNGGIDLIDLYKAPYRGKKKPDKKDTIQGAGEGSPSKEREQREPDTDKKLGALFGNMFASMPKGESYEH